MQTIILIELCGKENLMEIKLGLFFLILLLVLVVISFAFAVYRFSKVYSQHWLIWFIIFILASAPPLLVLYHISRKFFLF